MGKYRKYELPKFFEGFYTSTFINGFPVLGAMCNVWKSVPTAKVGQLIPAHSVQTSWLMLYRTEIGKYRLSPNIAHLN